MFHDRKHKTFSLKSPTQICAGLSPVRGRSSVSLHQEKMALLAVCFPFPLLLKALTEPNKALPCVLGALTNISSIKLRMERSTDSSRQEASGALAATDRQTQAQSSRHASSKLEVPASSLAGATPCLEQGSQGPQGAGPTPAPAPFLSALWAHSPFIPAQLSTWNLCLPVGLDHFTTQDFFSFLFGNVLAAFLESQMS